MALQRLAMQGLRQLTQQPSPPEDSLDALTQRTRDWQTEQDEQYDQGETTTATGFRMPNWVFPWARLRADPNMGTMSILAQGLRETESPRVRFPNSSRSKVF